MRFPKFILVAAIWLTASPVAAVVVFQRGATEPVVGYLVRETEQEVVLRLSLEAGKSEDVTIRKSEIEELLYTVDAARLSALNPARPQEYREYADELAEKKLDPEARDAALRLYVIAAWLDPSRSRAPLLGLVPLARTADEESRFRAAAYLADPHHDPAILRGTVVGAAAKAPDYEARRNLLEAARLVRQGKGDVAERLLDRPEIAAELGSAAAIVSQQEFRRLCRLSQIDSGQLRTLIKLELALVSAIAPQEPSAASGRHAAQAWSALSGKPTSPLAPLAIEHLTEFDPRKCVFRGGTWVAP